MHQRFPAESVLGLWDGNDGIADLKSISGLRTASQQRWNYAAGRTAAVLTSWYATLVHDLRKGSYFIFGSVVLFSCNI